MSERERERERVRERERAREREREREKERKTHLPLEDKGHGRRNIFPIKEFQSSIHQICWRISE